MTLTVPAGIVQRIDPIVVHIDHFDHNVLHVGLLPLHGDLSIGDIEILVEDRHELLFGGGSFHNEESLDQLLWICQCIFLYFFWGSEGGTRTLTACADRF
jgi:hypothetical protein